MTSKMKVSADGRKQITQREANKLTAYQDGGGVWTIGIGHTSAAGPPVVKKGMKITAAQSDSILASDLADVENDINTMVKVTLNQSQFDALGSFVLNIGGPAFRKSTFLRKLNAGDYAGAANQFQYWNKDNGKTVTGLTNRRKSEKAQFLSQPSPKAMPTPISIPASTVSRVYTDPIHVRIIQQELFEKGYTEVGSRKPDGTFDGDYGTMTKSAILLAKSENNIEPINDVIDDGFLDALPLIKQRVLARVDTSDAKVREIVPEAKSAFFTKILAAFGLGGTGLVGIGKGVLDFVTPWKDTFSDIPSYVWMGLIAAFFIAIIVYAHRGEKTSVQAYQDGARR